MNYRSRCRVPNMSWSDRNSEQCRSGLLFKDRVQAATVHRPRVWDFPPLGAGVGEKVEEISKSICEGSSNNQGLDFAS